MFSYDNSTSPHESESSSESFLPSFKIELQKLDETFKLNVLNLKVVSNLKGLIESTLHQSAPSSHSALRLMTEDYDKG